MPLQSVLVEVTMPPENPVVVEVFDGAPGKDAPPVLFRTAQQGLPTFPRTFAIGGTLSTVFPVLVFYDHEYGRGIWRTEGPDYDPQTGEGTVYSLSFPDDTYEAERWILARRLEGPISVLEYEGWWASLGHELDPLSAVWTGSAQAPATGVPVLTPGPQMDAQEVGQFCIYGPDAGVYRLFIATAAGIGTSRWAEADTAAVDAVPNTVVMRGPSGSGRFASSDSTALIATSAEEHGIVGSSAGFGVGLIGGSEGGSGLLAITNAGQFHAEFGGGDDGVFIARVSGAICWLRSGVFGKLTPPVALAAARSWEFPDASGKVTLLVVPGVVPTTIGDLVIEKTSNTILTLKLKGTDGTVRSAAIPLS